MHSCRAIKLTDVHLQLEYAWDNLDVELKGMTRKPNKNESAEEYIRYLSDLQKGVWIEMYSRGGQRGIPPGPVMQYQGNPRPNRPYQSQGGYQPFQNTFQNVPRYPYNNAPNDSRPYYQGANQYGNNFPPRNPPFNSQYQRPANAGAAPYQGNQYQPNQG